MAHTSGKNKAARKYSPSFIASGLLAGRTCRCRLDGIGGQPGPNQGILIIDAMMRKLVQIAYGVLKSGQPFNPALRGC